MQVPSALRSDAEIWLKPARLQRWLFLWLVFRRELERNIEELHNGYGDYHVGC